MGIKTYRLKLTIMYTVAVVLMYVAFAVTLYYEYKRFIFETIDNELLASARSTLNKDSRGISLLETTSKDKEIITKVGDEYYQLASRGGTITVSSSAKNHYWPLNRELMIKAFQGSPQFDNVTYQNESVRTLYFPMERDRILRVGEPIGRIRKEMAEIERLGLFFFPIILLMSSGMSWILAGKSLSPVIRISLLAERIRQGKMNERIDIGLKGKEIDELVTILNDMLDTLQRSMEAQKRFTSDVSHEIRSPLTSLRGTIEVALRKVRSAEEYQEVLKSNLEDIKRLSRISDNLLFLARADNNILELRKQWFQVHHLLDGVIDRLSHKALNSDISVIRDYSTDIELYGDVDLLDQAFSNLVDNAIKYSLPGGKVTVSATMETAAITVSISDAGIGIPKEDISHIFERFYRVSKERSRKTGGTGLGLSITKWIINAHGGKILARSEKSGGSVFVVTLPNITD
jgi:heavy metal sensor kinase